MRVDKLLHAGFNCGERSKIRRDLLTVFLLWRGLELFDYHFHCSNHTLQPAFVSSANLRQAKVSRSKIDLPFVDLERQVVRIPEKCKRFIRSFIDAKWVEQMMAA
jgi:hypothetical protein